MSQLVWGFSGKVVVMPSDPRPEVAPRPRLGNTAKWESGGCYDGNGRQVGSITALMGGVWVWCTVDSYGAASTGTAPDEQRAKDACVRSAIHRGLLPKVGVQP